jgi:hypothetical protein
MKEEVLETPKRAHLWTAALTQRSRTMFVTQRLRGMMELRQLLGLSHQMCKFEADKEHQHSKNKTRKKQPTSEKASRSAASVVHWKRRVIARVTLRMPRGTVVTLASWPANRSHSAMICPRKNDFVSRLEGQSYSTK